MKTFWSILIGAALATVLFALVSCEPEPSGPESRDPSELRSDPRMARLINEALEESPDEQLIAETMNSLYQDYGMFSPDDEPTVFAGRGLTPAVGGNRCAWERIYADAALCGIGAAGLARNISNPWGAGSVFVGTNSICVARSLQTNCSWANIQGPGGGGGGGSW